MIRFVYIGDQIRPHVTAEREPVRDFAFYNTVNEQFEEYDGELYFESVHDFVQNWVADPRPTMEKMQEQLDRRLGLIPGWYRDGEEPPAGDWIAIAEQMPRVGQSVWLGVVDPPAVAAGYADGERWRHEGGVERYGDTYWTHWAPRQSPPAPPGAS